MGFVLSAVLENGAVSASQAGQSPTIPSREVASFNVRGLCLVDALLALGQQEQVPLGIEYVGRDALEKPITEDFHSTTVGKIVEVLLGGGKGYTWCVRDGVLNVSHKSVAAGKGNLFDRVLPEFVIRRCSVADASNVLYMSLNRQLHPEITGYLGEYNPGDMRNLVGPLELRNTPVRDILNRLVSSANRRAAWIVQVQPGCLDQLPSGGLWTIIEYQTPPRQYAAELLRRVFGR
jgi:hypothetical protein